MDLSHLNFDLLVECDGTMHTLRIEGGEPLSGGHGSIEEAVLRALGGEVLGCILAVGAYAVAPRQLAVAEAISIRKFPFAGPWQPSAREHFAKQGEPSLDAFAVPSTVRRLAALKILRTLPQDAQERKLIVDRLVRNRADEVLRVVFGSLVDAEVDHSDGGKHSSPIVVAPGWLTTVWPLGLESVGGNFTLGARSLSDLNQLVLTQVSLDGPSGDGVVFQRRIRLGDVRPDIQLRHPLPLLA